ncbi:MAG: ROK family protein [Actinobacteria bacterium]|nr:MAG: ROK family protein [Actinomycetota bacterium]
MSSLRGGIDLGGTKIQALVVDGERTVRGRARHPTPTTGGPEQVAEAMVAAQQEAAQDAGLSAASELRGVGAGCPGQVDADAGTVERAGNLPHWEAPFPLAERLQRGLAAPVRLGNDVSVATMAEFHLGGGAPYSSLLGVFWGTGVGGGIVLDGRLWEGRGSAGEIGHTVIKRGGARCPCGRRGCLEAYAGRKAMEARARAKHERGTKTELFEIMRHRGRDRLTSGVWERAVDGGDHLAHRLLERAVRALGTGIASAINLLDVEAVVLGGGLGVRFGARYLQDIEREMVRHLFHDSKPPKLFVTELGDDGGGLGAAMLVPEHPQPARAEPAGATAG